MPVRIEVQPGKEIIESLSRGIVEFNRNAVADLEPNTAEVKFHAVARTDAGEVVGGLRGTCYWNTLHIELLWLSEAARGSGSGRELVQEAEQFAVANGCAKAWVETTSWQAKPFYEKLGYRLLATLEGRPKGHSSHYLAKDLS